MREKDFADFLNNEPSISSSKAVAIRMKHAKRAEQLIRTDLDTVINNDDAMYEVLEKLRQSDSPSHAHMQNAVRKYYKFRNGREFPKMKDYHSPKHP